VANNRTSAGLFKAHVAALVVVTVLVFPLTFTYMWLELAHWRPVVMAFFICSFCVSNFLGGLALKRIGYSPWLGLTGFAMGLVPLILYLALPERPSRSS